MPFRLENIVMDYISRYVNKVVNSELSLILSIGHVFCIIPWYDTERNDLYNPVANRIVASGYIILLGAITISLLFNYNFYIQHLNIFEKIFQLVEIINSVSLVMIVITIFNFVKRKQWRYFLRKMTERSVDLYYIRRDTSNLIFTVIVWHFIFAFAKGLKVYYDFQEFKLHGLARLLQEYYCFLSALIASCLAHSIRKKYEDLGELLRVYIKTPANDMILSTRIINVGKKFRCITELVECYNDMFGWLIILTLLKVIMGILKWANLLIVLMGHEQISLVIIVPLLCYTFLGFAGSMLIILSCDAAASAGANIQRDCYKLQERLHMDSRSRAEIFKLSKIVKSYYPRFTAANLFIIRKSTILKIINIVTAYIIVMIQLREKYDKPDKSTE